MTPDQLRAAGAVCRRTLYPARHTDWAVPIPGMDWTVARAVAHIADTVLWYATDAVEGERELSTLDLRVRPESSPEDLIRTVTAFTEVLARVLDGMPPDTRGWHSYGRADASGFVGMACDEILVHTGDAAAGLGLDYQPPAELCRAVLERLFPWAPTDVDPWRALLWANGRLALPGHGRLEDWRWHCAPLSEWDGRIPARVVA